MTARSKFQQVQVVNADGVDTWDVTEGLGDTLHRKKNTHFSYQITKQIF